MKRHLTALLNAVDARTKLLITLSDGKPDDYSDNYRGEYGETLLQGTFQTEDGYCIVAALPGDFLFSSLWRFDGVADPAMLQEIVRRIEQWLGKRFAEFVDPQPVMSES